MVLPTVLLCKYGTHRDKQHTLPEAATACTAAKSFSSLSTPANRDANPDELGAAVGAAALQRTGIRELQPANGSPFRSEAWPVLERLLPVITGRGIIEAHCGLELVTWWRLSCILQCRNVPFLHFSTRTTTKSTSSHCRNGSQLLTLWKCRSIIAALREHWFGHLVGPHWPVFGVRCQRGS